MRKTIVIPLTIALVCFVWLISAQPALGLAPRPKDGIRRPYEDTAMLSQVSSSILDPAAAETQPQNTAGALPDEEPPNLEIDMQAVEAELNAVKDERNQLKKFCDNGKEQYKDDACRLQKLLAYCSSNETLLAAQEKAIRVVWGDHRKGITKFFGRIWHGIGPAGRRIWRNISKEAIGMTLGGQNVTKKVVQVLLKKHVKSELKTVIFDRVFRNSTVALPNDSDCNENTDENPEFDAVGEDVGDVLTDAYAVRVYKGNAAKFRIPPKYAYANALEYPSDKGLITYPPSDLIFPAGSVVSLHEPGLWIEMAYSEPATAVGVEFIGDFQDRWARVLVDGTPIWRGNTFFENCPFDENGVRQVHPDKCKGGFIYYIEASGLENTTHTLRVENAGDGEVSIWFFGLGKVKP